jgi:DNA anti-recombination protein RmuC
MGSATSGAARSRSASARLKEKGVRAMKNEQATRPARAAHGNGKAPLDEVAAGSLDKVRDILFGAQARDADRRFARLEERIAKENADLKEEVRKRLTTLEVFVKREFESMADRLKTEHDARSEADKDLTRDLRESSKASDKKFSQVDDQVARVQRELRQQLLDTHQKISDEIRQQAQETLMRLAREASELRNDKLDRSALAATLTEIALRLSGDQTPGADGA